MPVKHFGVVRRKPGGKLTHMAMCHNHYVTTKPDLTHVIHEVTCMRCIRMIKRRQGEKVR